MPPQTPAATLRPNTTVSFPRLGGRAQPVGHDAQMGVRRQLTRPSVPATTKLSWGPPGKDVDESHRSQRLNADLNHECPVVGRVDPPHERTTPLWPGTLPDRVEPSTRVSEGGLEPLVHALLGRLARRSIAAEQRFLGQVTAILPASRRPAADTRRRRERSASRCKDRRREHLLWWTSARIEVQPADDSDIILISSEGERPMPDILIRDVPEDVIALLKQHARAPRPVPHRVPAPHARPESVDRTTPATVDDWRRIRRTPRRPRRPRGDATSLDMSTATTAG